MSQPYEEMNEGYTQVFNDDNKLNKSTRPHIDKSLRWYRKNLEYARDRANKYNLEHREETALLSRNRYHWHRSWGGDTHCQFSLLRISLEAFK